jgi:hypothetical protein
VDKTHVVWISYHRPEIIARGYWDQGLLEDVFKQGEFEHHDSFEWADHAAEKGRWPGAIVIINGRTHIEDTAKINADIAKLKWVLFIDTGDEEATFPWREVTHPLMRVWMMLPRMNQHDDVHYKLPNGYRPTTHKTLGELGYRVRNIDYMFAGQVNHPRREECVAVLEQHLPLYPSSVLVKTDTFGKEAISYPDYLGMLARTKIALCPSGIESPDNFRLYEALEAGCLPVVDAFSTNFQTPGFWQYLFGGDVPFPVVSYWDKLPEMLPQLLAEWPERSAKCFGWWQQKKREIKFRLLDDVKELSR